MLVVLGLLAFVIEFAFMVGVYLLASGVVEIVLGLALLAEARHRPASQPVRSLRHAARRP